MRQISSAIMLDCEEMYNNEKSPFYLVYMDSTFRSQDKRHSVRKLLRLGWLTCLFRSAEEQHVELWNLINPTMAESISKSDVMDFVKTLTTFAIDINKSKYKITEKLLIRSSYPSESLSSRTAICGSLTSLI